MNQSRLPSFARSSRLWLRLALPLAVVLNLLGPAPTLAIAAGGIVDIIVGPGGYDCSADGWHQAAMAAEDASDNFFSVRLHIRCSEIDISDVTEYVEDSPVRVIGENPEGILNAPAQSRVTLNAQGLSRVFAITTTAHVTLENLTIINGNASSGFGSGGDIYNAGTLDVRNSEIAHGAAGYGGGLYNAPGATATLVDSVVDFNHATVNGGGIASDAGAHLSLQFTGSTNTTCVCSNTADAYGAGIFSQGALDVAPGTLFNNNAAGYAGGALAAFGSNTLILAPSGNSAAPSLALAAGQSLAAPSAVLAPTRFISNSAGGGGGGAIYNTGALKLSQVEILSNTTSNSGGGIESYTGTLQISNALLAYNKASIGGGAIQSNWLLTATAISVISNTAVYQSGGLDLYFGSAVVRDSVFVSNTAGLGGAIAISSGKLHLDSSTVADNVVDNAGGGLYQAIAGSTTIANSTFSGNISNGGDAGGLKNFGLLTITSSSLISNSAPGDIGNLVTGSGGSTWLHDSLVAFGAPVNCSGTITSTGYNLDSANTCHLHATGDLTNTNPLIGPLADNGGVLAGVGGMDLPFDGQAAWTHALLGGSPGIDTGDQANCPAVDERGAVRPPSGCDIGAFEFGAKIAQTINFTLPALVIPAQSPYPLAGTATSGLVVSYTASGAACSLAGSSLLLNSTGPCAVTAHQAGNANFNPAADVLATTTVALALYLPLVSR